MQSSHLRPLRWRQAATRTQPIGAPVGAVVYRRLFSHSPHFTVFMRTASPWSTKLKAAVVIKSQKKKTRLTAQFTKSVRNLANLANRQFLNLCLNIQPLLIWVLACAWPPNDTGSAPQSPEDAPVHRSPQAFTSSWQLTYANFQLWLQLWQQSSIWEIYQKIPQPTLWPRSFLFVKRKSSKRMEMLEMMYSLRMLKTRTICRT